MSEFSNNLHVQSVPLRWSDFDRFGHVMNANYIEIAQEARVEFANEHFEARGHEFAVFVRHIESDYLRPILPDTTVVTVETQVVEIGNTSFTTRQEIKDRQGRVACVVECVQVAIDMEAERPRSLTQKEVGILTQGPDADVVGDIA
ncbi:thioesterase family protein [Corynebacterium breve]|uniref:Thioesterase family protein n=1 Tax=Corynebacterium breve TaxID=3049799 RepID=A0ABY8VC11_9CORY|nr:thioesterase family protein [Corynebacterium breve]WIM67211.1 thioesterase family protein [Corynebacterium breve]